MTELKLIALDEEDLAVVSSLLQDAVVRAADMTYLPAQKRFAAIVSRFDWEKAAKAPGAKDFRRQRTALRFDRVFGAKLKNVKPSGDSVLSLLAVGFEPGDAPGGRITLTFSGDASIQLEVECIEAELKDLGLVWRTRSRPEHPGDEPGAGSEPAGSGS